MRWVHLVHRARRAVPASAAILFLAGAIIAPQAASGLLAPAATPPAIVKTLGDAIAAVLALPEVQRQFSEQGAEPHAESPDQFAAFIRAESVKWAKAVKESGATVD